MQRWALRRFGMRLSRLRAAQTGEANPLSKAYVILDRISVFSTRNMVHIATQFVPFLQTSYTHYTPTDYSMPRQLTCSAPLAVLILRTVHNIVMGSASVAPIVSTALRTLLTSAASL
jgi:hypothetical protein